MQVDHENVLTPKSDCNQSTFTIYFRELRPKAIPDITISPTLRQNYLTNDKAFFAYLENRSTIFNEFIKSGAINSDNCLEVLQVLVQLETIGLDETYKKLSQHRVEVTGCAGEYSAKVCILELPMLFTIKP